MVFSRFPSSASTAGESTSTVARRVVFPRRRFDFDRGSYANARGSAPSRSRVFASRVDSRVVARRVVVVVVALCLRPRLLRADSRRRRSTRRRWTSRVDATSRRGVGASAREDSRRHRRVARCDVTAGVRGARWIRQRSKP
jgi:hypothetical protein